MLQNDNFKNITVGIAIVAVLFVMLFSVFYVSQHVEHECTGEDCPICAVLELCENSIKSMGAIAIAEAVIYLLGAPVQKSVQYAVVIFFKYSLISQKVRMNN